MYGSIMSDEARAWNNAHDNIRNMYYDREISKIEKLAQKELEDEIVVTVVATGFDSDYYNEPADEQPVEQLPKTATLGR